MLAALLTSAAHAQVAAAIGGQVYNSANDDFINGVTVVLTDASGALQPQSFVTETRGLFLFENLPHGRYLLFAECPGYARAAFGSRGNSVSGVTLSLVEAQQMTGLAFALTPASSIAGRVIDAAGAPVSGARVFAVQPVYQRGKKEYAPLASAISDVTGAYKLGDLGAGTYSLVAIDATGANAPAWPAEPVVAGAAAGVEAGDIRMTKAAGHRVGGALDGAVKPAVAWLTPKGGATSLMLRRPAKVQADGGFVFDNVAAAAYLLYATGTDGVTPAAAPIPVTVGQKDMDSLALHADAGAELSGEIALGNNETAVPAGMQVILENADAPLPRPARAAVDGKGKFNFPKLAPGHYLVHVLAPESLYVRTVHYRGADASEEGFTFGGGAPGPLLIGLSAAGAAIGGTVRGADGSPMPGATVALVPTLRRLSRYKEATTDQFGEYHFYGIAPGDYKVYAWDHIETGRYQDAAWLKQFEFKGQPFAAKAGGRETIPLVVK